MQPRIIILEGPDGGGKSTLLGQLASWLSGDGPVWVQHHGPYLGEKDLARRYFKSITHALNNKAHVILDRSWLSEPIYARAFRKQEPRISRWEQRMLERAAMGRDCVVIRCQPDWKWCREAYIRRKGIEYLETTSQLKEVYKDYAALAEHTDAPVLHYDYHKKSFGELLHELQQTTHNIGPGFGRWQPGEVVLLVGERTNPNAYPGQGTKDWAPTAPFVSFSGGGCSRPLTEALEEAGIRESQLYWINAMSPGGDPYDPGFVKVLRPAKVIALGAEASVWCRQVAGVDHVNVHHPQYTNRFKQGDFSELVREIVSALR